MIKHILVFSSLLCLISCGSFMRHELPAKSTEILFAGNAFITKTSKISEEKITKNGLENWTSSETIISCYFKINTVGYKTIYLKLDNAEDNAIIKCTYLGKATSIETNSKTKMYHICTTTLKDTGYIKVDIQGIKKTTDVFATNPSLFIRSSATNEYLTYANDKANFYWSRRGPSCHLNYTIPKKDIEYFYSEITVPSGEDKIGSYFMANGFADGYFGIQVNSATERRILFSVWEEDDKPKTILLKKGTNVIAGRFDGEGTGGQSFLVYDWKPDFTYKFLTKGEPDGEGNTIYTSWFFMPEKNKWELIASFKRQNKSTYLTGFYSFIENFEQDNGYLSRKALYSNQWVKIKNGDWLPITECSFSADATAKNKQRLDCSGGVENGKFFLQNGGFSNFFTIPKTVFKVENKNAAPSVNFD